MLATVAIAAALVSLRHSRTDCNPMNSRLARWLALVALLGCGTPDAVGDYGQYHIANQWIRLGSGDSLRVFRLKYWVFTDGSKPAVQLEYSSPSGVADSAAAFPLMERIWAPQRIRFVRYRN
jgi:hypothetical protein